MRTSLNEIKDIEQYTQGNLSVDDKRAFEERIQHDSSFSINVFLQQKLYRLLPFYKRRRIKEQAEQLHHRLFHHPEHSAFRESIFRLF
jgi:anti-sigma-K factor RskA